MKEVESASKKKWNEARILQKAKASVKRDYRSARANGQLYEFERGQLVWVVKETTRLMTINAWGPYVVDQILEGYRYKLVDHRSGEPTKPVSGRYLKPYRKGDTLDDFRVLQRLVSGYI